MSLFWNANGRFSPDRVLPPVPPGACIIWAHWTHNTLLLRGLVWVRRAHPREMVAVCFPVLGRPCFSNDFYQRTVGNWFGKEEKRKKKREMRQTSEDQLLKKPPWSQTWSPLYQSKSVVLLDFCLEAGTEYKFGVLPSSSGSLRHGEAVAMCATCEN